MPIDNVANRFLKVLESTSSAFAFATTLAPYLKIGNALIGGVNELLGLGTTQPIAGWQQQFDYDGERPLIPGYFALINGAEISTDSLWISGGRLNSGTRAAHKPYREADYVLFSIGESPDGRRNDLDRLDWYPLWERVLKDAVDTTPSALTSMQANFAALTQSILLSPDLTESQASELIDDYFKQAQDERNRNKQRTFLAEPSQTERLAAKSTDALRERSLKGFSLS